MRSASIPVGSGHVVGDYRVQCPLLALSGQFSRVRVCPLMTQSGHYNFADILKVRRLNLWRVCFYGYCALSLVARMICLWFLRDPEPIDFP
jgi:hypothetical protein